MKLTTGKRVLFAVHWVISVFLLLTGAFPRLGSGIQHLVSSLLGFDAARIVLYSCAVIYLLLCAAVAVALFKTREKRDERGFITVDASETGRVRISISAAEHMVKQAVCNIDGIQDLKVTVAGDDDAITVDTCITMVGGSHVPTITMNMQRAIRQFVEVNCGVAVRSVSVSILNVTGSAEINRKNKRPAVAPVIMPTFSEEDTTAVNDVCSEEGYASADDILTGEAETVFDEQAQAENYTTDSCDGDANGIGEENAEISEHSFDDEVVAESYEAESDQYDAFVGEQLSPAEAKDSIEIASAYEYDESSSDIERCISEGDDLCIVDESVSEGDAFDLDAEETFSTEDDNETEGDRKTCLA